MRKFFNIIVVCAMLSISLACPSFAADAMIEQEIAAAYLRETGIMVGNGSGDMMLDQGLTRAQMAVILSRVAGNPEHVEADSVYYSSRCEFADVPDWAKSYVGYCAANHLVAGYGNGLYGSDDPVTLAAACTVMLRCLDDVGMEWGYDTACQTAVALGLISTEALAEAEITRGDMAVLTYRTMARMGYDVALPDTIQSGEESRNIIGTTSDSTICLPTDGSRYVPQVGDVIRCDDGSLYTITNTDRWDTNVFAAGPVGDLPVATCNWSLFEEPALPAVNARHFVSERGDTMWVRNLYETRRMQMTIYNALGTELSAWDGDTALAQVSLTIPEHLDAFTNTMWPWRASELEKLVYSRPASLYYVEAWDYYLNGVFQYTRYCIASI